jgi:hypothetical protein
MWCRSRTACHADFADEDRISLRAGWIAGDGERIESKAAKWETPAEREVQAGVPVLSKR